MEAKSSSVSSSTKRIVVVLFLIVALFGTYTTCYFTRCYVVRGGYGRVYNSRWEALLFFPALKLEAQLTNKSMRLLYISRNKLSGERQLDEIK